MKKLSLLMAAVFAAGFAWGQDAAGSAAPVNTPPAAASNGTVSNIDGLKSFSTLTASGKIQLFVSVAAGQNQSMTIEYNGNDQNKFKWWDNDGTLQLKFSSSPKDLPIVVRLTCARLSNVDLMGASMSTVAPWAANMMTVNLGAGSKLTATIETSDIQLDAVSKSVAVIDGLTTYAAFNARTRSSIDASNLDSKSTTLQASGYAECRVHGSERLVIDAVDGSSIFWRGGPQILRVAHSRGATVNPIGE